MPWVVAGIIAGLLLGAFVTFLVIANTLTKGLGKAFGIPTAPWWKFW